jgi:hypothetical protein
VLTNVEVTQLLNCIQNKKRLAEASLLILEAPSGLEPLNDRFAIYSLSRLGTAPCALKNIAELIFFVHRFMVKREILTEFKNFDSE